MTELLLSLFTCFLVDQGTKVVFSSAAAQRVYRAGPVSLRVLMNLNPLYRSRGGQAGMTLLWIAAFLSALLLAGRTILDTPLSLVAVGIALGGALGNLRDIIVHGGVRDFIDLGWWPVFNFGDVAIIAGLSLAFITA